MKHILLACLIVMLTASVAVSATWTETDPTLDTLGNTLVSDGITITSRNFYCGATPGNETATAVQTGTAKTFTTALAPGQSETCYVTVTASNGEVSAHSNEVTKSAPNPIPAPPGCN